ncbi:MAG: SGNH/GDSL hydrolase family protein [Acidobacteriaceae bacterium]
MYRVAAFCTLLIAAPLCRAANFPPHPSPWVATWGAAMVPTEHGTEPEFSGQTLRQIIHTSLGGTQTRVWFSNRFGSEPLRIGAAHIAICASASLVTNSASDADDRSDKAAHGPDESGIQPGSDRVLTFDHLTSVVIPPGATVVSDPVALDVPALSDIAVSAYFPGHTLGMTEHTLALQTSYAVSGDVVDVPNLTGKSWPMHSWYFLTGVDVYAPGDSAVVTLGDSITDGDHSTAGENHRWPNFLAARLAASPAARQTGTLGVVDSGIDGNRVLLDGWGPNALSRINRDILARSGARYLIVLESINDIGRYTDDHQPYGDLAERLEAGLAQIAAQAHQHGMRVFGATLTPYEDCGYYSPAGEQVREAVNQWIRTSRVFDGVIDFDKAVRDPQRPLRFLPQYNSGDDLHPNDAGYKAMANAIDLSLFTKKH